MRHLLLLTTILALSVPAWTAARADEEPVCPAASLPPMAVAKSRAALTANEQLVIVAVGSSSTQSWMSSNAAHSYPAILQEALMHLLPKAHVSVINRGVGGEDAAEEIVRLATDVIAVKPQLVIWQVGANGALRDSNPEIFSRLVSSGVSQLHAAGADVILMDNQRAPSIVAKPHHMLIDQATADVAVKTGASLFPRGEMMDQWQKEGAPYANFMSPDGLHFNDLGYRCTALALATSIAAGLGPDKPGG